MSILRLNSFLEYQSHHPLYKIRKIIESFIQAIKVEIRSASAEDAIDLIEFNKELENVNSTNNPNLESLNAFVNDLQSRLAEKGFNDVIINAFKKEESQLKFTDKLELVFKRVQASIPKEFKGTLNYSNFDFHEKYKEVDLSYCEYQNLLAFREIHSIFSNIELNYKQRFAFILGSFLTHVPENSLHIFDYLNKVGKVTQTYLGHCQINECDNNSVDSVCEGVSLALGYAIAFSLQTALKQSANVQICMLENADEQDGTNVAIELVESLHAIDDYLLCKDSAFSILNDNKSDALIEKFFGIDTTTLLTLPNAISVARILDWLVPQTVGYDFYPLNYDDIQEGLSQEINTTLIQASAMHTLIALLKKQFPENE